MERSRHRSSQNYLHRLAGVASILRNLLEPHGSSTHGITPPLGTGWFCQHSRQWHFSGTFIACWMVGAAQNVGIQPASSPEVLVSVSMAQNLTEPANPCDDPEPVVAPCWDDQVWVYGGCMGDRQGPNRRRPLTSFADWVTRFWVERIGCKPLFEEGRLSGRA
jgi:hypothetical protein